MSTVIISPQGTAEDETAEVIQLQVLVSDDDFVGLFNVLEVWRSTSGEEGPYYEQTAASRQPAHIPKTASDPPASPPTGASVTINGLDLDLRVDEQTDLTITFSGVDPLTYSELATQITAQGQSLVTGYVDESGLLVAQTVKSGVGAALRVVGGDAAGVLGLPTTEPDSLAYGQNARIPLIEGTELYSFTDYFGSSEYYYRTRFRNSTSGAVSAFSQPFAATTPVGVSQDNLVYGYVDLVGADGRPLRNHEVVVHLKHDHELVEDKLVAGTDIRMLTNDNGRASFLLVRGKQITVSVTGAEIARDVLVPTDSSISQFNLFSSSVGVGEDIFKVQVPEIISAERRTL